MSKVRRVPQQFAVRMKSTLWNLDASQTKSFVSLHLNDIFYITELLGSDSFVLTRLFLFFSMNRSLRCATFAHQIAPTDDVPPYKKQNADERAWKCSDALHHLLIH